MILVCNYLGPYSIRIFLAHGVLLEDDFQAVVLSQNFSCSDSNMVVLRLSSCKMLTRLARHSRLVQAFLVVQRKSARVFQRCLPVAAAPLERGNGFRV